MSSSWLVLLSTAALWVGLACAPSETQRYFKETHPILDPVTEATEQWTKLADSHAR